MRFSWIVLFGVVAVAVLALNAVPYLIAIQHTPLSSFYSGQLFLPSDIPTYYAKMQTGYEGNLLYTNLFTTETPNPSVPLHLFYTALGLFTRVIGSDVVTVFTAARFFAGFLFLFSIWWFCMRIVHPASRAVLSFLHASFASGLGWFFLLTSTAASNLLDIYVPAFMPIARYSTVPHVSIASALFVFTLYALLRYSSSQEKKFLSLIAILLFLENFILPYYAIGLYAIIFAYTLFAWRSGRIIFRSVVSILCALAISLPSFFLMAIVALTNPLWKSSQLEAFVWEPSIPGFIIGYGLLAVFAVAEIIKQVKERTIGHSALSLLLSSWMFVPFVLAFIPWMPQRSRMYEIPFIIPFAILSSSFIFWLVRKIAPYYHPFLRGSLISVFACALILFFGLSSWVVIARIPSLLETEKPTAALYIPWEIFSASAWMKDNSAPPAAILSSGVVGNMLPYLTSRYVYLGHWSETVQFWKKMAEVEKFYKGELSEEGAKSLLEKNRIQFVMYSPYEKALGSVGISRYRAFLQKEFQEKETAVFRVLPPM